MALRYPGRRGWSKAEGAPFPGGGIVNSEAQEDLREYCLEVAQRARRASVELARVTGAVKQAWLRRSARLLGERSVALAEANRLDLAAAPGFGLSPAQIDRLRLTPKEVASIAQALEEVAALPDPIGEVIWSSVRPNGLQVHKVRVPLGVIFFIYESRPNVTADAAALCVKAGNAVILRGGKEAAHSNRAIAEIMAEAAADVGLPSDAVQLVATPDREAVGHFLNMPEFIDLVIPRGGEGLIRRVTAEAKMPVLKHYAGNCHVYLDASADPDLAERLVLNSKCQRMGVCNAAESLVVHAAVASSLLPRVAAAEGAHGQWAIGDQGDVELAAGLQDAVELGLARGQAVAHLVGGQGHPVAA